LGFDLSACLSEGESIEIELALDADASFKLGGHTRVDLHGFGLLGEKASCRSHCQTRVKK